VSKPPPAAGRSGAGSPRGRVVWYGLMAVSGFGFGLLAERRPFGEGILVHPLVVFFALTGLGLLAVRTALARPVPEVIPDRTLMLGCVLGLATFLAGNFVAARLLPLN
jgi:hypothetical protein